MYYMTSNRPKQSIKGVTMSNIIPSGYLPEKSEYALLHDISLKAFKSGLLPQSIKNPEAALSIALKGRELGIPPMLAFGHLHIVKGKVGMSAELMLAQIYKIHPKATVNYLKNSPEGCIVEASRINGKKSTFSFTIEDAKRADLLGKDNWKQYPEAMCRARAISAMARAMFPDAIMGASYTPEELEGIDSKKPISPRDVTPDVDSNQDQDQQPESKISNEPETLAETVFEMEIEQDPIKEDPIQEEKQKETSNPKNVAPVDAITMNKIKELREVKGISSDDIRNCFEQFWGESNAAKWKIWQAEVVVGLLRKADDREHFGAIMMDYEQEIKNH